jgi:hypothetical protein
MSAVSAATQPGIVNTQQTSSRKAVGGNIVTLDQILKAPQTKRRHGDKGLTRPQLVKMIKAKGGKEFRVGRNLIASNFDVAAGFHRGGLGSPKLGLPPDRSSHMTLINPDTGRGYHIQKVGNGKLKIDWGGRGLG